MLSFLSRDYNICMVRMQISVLVTFVGCSLIHGMPSLAQALMGPAYSAYFAVLAGHSLIHRMQSLAQRLMGSA